MSTEEYYVYDEASGEWLPASELAAKLLDIGAGTNEIRRMLIGRELIGAAG